MKLTDAVFCQVACVTKGVLKTDAGVTQRTEQTISSYYRVQFICNLPSQSSHRGYTFSMEYEYFLSSILAI